MIVKRFAAGTVQPGGQFPPAFSAFENCKFLGVFQQESRTTSPLIQTPMGADVHRFCPVPDCDVVYLAAKSVFRMGDLAVPAWQESVDPTDFVCDCFEHSEDTIRGEIAAAGQTTALAEIKQRGRDGDCVCEVRNPQGTCSLGNASAVVKHAQSNQTDAVQ